MTKEELEYWKRIYLIFGRKFVAEDWVNFDDEWFSHVYVAHNPYDDINEYVYLTGGVIPDEGGREFPEFIEFSDKMMKLITK